MKSSRSIGILLMLGASLVFSGMGVLMKVASRSGLPVLEIVWFRALGSVLLLTPWMLWKRLPLFGTRKDLLLLRSIAGCIALLFNVYALSRLSLGDTAILNQTSPIFVAIISALLLKEHVTPTSWICILLALVGSALIIKPSGDWSLVPGLAGLASGIFAAIAYVSIRRLHDSESPYTIVLQFSWVSLLVSTVGIAHFELPSGSTTWVLAGIGILGTIAQLLMTLAYRHGEASFVSPFSFSSAIFSLLWDILLWSDHPGWASLTGTALIILCGVVLMRHKTKSGEIG